MQIDKGKILVVDDEPSNIDILINILEDTYDIIIAKTGKLALKRAQKAIPDLILLDVLLPDLNGLEVCKQLKANDQTKEIPVIFISALTNSGDEKQGLEAGAIDYLTKPISPHILKARVENHFELKKHRDLLEELVRKRTREFEHAKIVAERASAAKDELLANMSHELLTPLNAIILSADMAKIQNSQPELATMHDTISESAHTLLNLIHDVLEFSQTADSDLEIEHDPFYLDDLIQDLNDTIVHKGIKQKPHLSYEIDPQSLPNALVGNPEKLKRILNALIDNATKFTSGLPKIVLGIELKQRENNKAILQFSIKDNGVGIPTNEFENIFKPFYQINASSSRNFDGIGMGLAICRRLLIVMKGQIWVESRLNESSTFYFTIETELQKRQTKFQIAKLTQNNAATQTVHKPAMEAVSEANKDALIKIFNELGNAILNMDPTTVNDQLNLIKQYIEPTNLNDLINQIKSYEYDEAMESLITISQSMGIQLPH